MKLKEFFENLEINKNNFFIFLVTLVILLTVFITLVITTPIKSSTYVSSYDLTVQHKENLLHLQQVKFNLVQETERYILKIAPTSCLNALVMVDACDEYDFDLIFALAQGQIESHYGTRGVASKTNSVFNVHSFDGLTADQIKSSGKGYSHPDHSVRPYLDLMNRRYLVDGKTEKDMFDKFVDKDGKRYASAENYEQSLMSTYLKIEAETKLDSLIDEYRKYKIITK